MLSNAHEYLLAILRYRPKMVATQVYAAAGKLMSSGTHARIESADLTDINPAEYRADLVVVLSDGKRDKLGIVVEVQLSRDERKQYVWPAYVSNLRARLKCPTCLLVLTNDPAVARWAAAPIDLGGGNTFAPHVIDLADIPEITDEAEARSNPELAMLSIMGHGKSSDISQAVRIASAALSTIEALDPERGRMYRDLILASLSDAAKAEVLAMISIPYPYKTLLEWHFAEEGKRDLVIRQCTKRFGPPNELEMEQLRDTSVLELDLIGEHLLTASTAMEAIEFARAAARKQTRLESQWNTEGRG